MENFIILVSHPYYGGCYVTDKSYYDVDLSVNNNLTKDINEAKIFTCDVADADKVAKAFSNKYKCLCYATIKREKQ